MDVKPLPLPKLKADDDRELEGARRGRLHAPFAAALPPHQVTLSAPQAAMMCKAFTEPVLPRSKEGRPEAKQKDMIKFGVSNWYKEIR